MVALPTNILRVLARVLRARNETIGYSYINHTHWVSLLWPGVYIDYRVILCDVVTEKHSMSPRKPRSSLFHFLVSLYSRAVLGPWKPLSVSAAVRSIHVFERRE